MQKFCIICKTPGRSGRTPSISPLDAILILGPIAIDRQPDPTKPGLERYPGNVPWFITSRPGKRNLFFAKNENALVCFLQK